MPARKAARARTVAAAVSAAMSAALAGAGWLALAGVAPAAEATTSEGLYELPRQDLPEPLLDSLRTALEAYEEVRSALAADRLEAVPDGAERLTGALRRALEDAAGLAAPTPEVVEETVHAAEALAAAEDLAAGRARFGELSRLLLLLAGSDPRLAEGRHVFSCPMVETFGKWIQPGDELENPYMGQAMPACGSASDWSVSAPAVAQPVRPAAAPDDGSPATSAAAGFEPGIPGLEMADVRDYKFLWREIEELQKWERGDRISVAEYRSKVIEKTVLFLGLGGAEADEFATAAATAVAAVRESFRQSRRAGGEVDGVAAGFSSTVMSSGIGAAVTGVTSQLREEPRHRLFAPECKRWLLKLAFGPSETKEAREARSGASGDRIQ